MDTNQTIRRSYEESKRIIQEAQENNQLVLFVGAGASIDSGMPSWSDALDKIKKRLGYEEKEERLIPNDPLKIPQYYFNQRGKNEYRRLMSGIFKYGETIPTTSLHQKLMKFNISTIITTNYDHLIEQAAEENGEVMQVISSDTDLPYKNLGKELIKMHGDFEHDNFVLKEDDYLNYSSNFKLIENYIKSIIGTKVVLFIGYSFNDPDIKQVFKWSKEILKDDMRKSYLINVDREYDKDLEDDYQSFGINVIFAKSWIKNENKEDIAPSILINQTLDKILDKNFSDLDSVYDSLKGFEDFNYVYGKYINQAFSQVGIILNKKDLLEAKNYESKEKAQKIFKILATQDTKEIKIIKEILSKSRVAGYLNSKGQQESFYKKEKGCDKKECKSIEWREAVQNFDFEKLRSIRDENNISLSENNPKKYLIQATISYYLGEYITSYEYLQQASKYLYKQHNYSFYLIAEINRKWVGQFILDNYLGSPQIRSKVKEEITNINFNRTLNSLPDLGNNNDFLKEITNFMVSYGMIHDVYNEGLKTREETNTIHVGEVIPEYKLLQNNVEDFFNYEFNNYLLLDNLVENINIYKMYIRNMLVSTTSSDKRSSLFGGIISGHNLHAPNFTEFELYIILKFFIDAREVNELFDDTIGLVEISDYGLDYLKTVVKNFNKNGNNTFDNIYWNLIALCGHTKLNSDLVIELLKSFILKISSSKSDINHQYITQVINSAVKQNHIIDVHKNLLEKLLDNILEKVILSKDDKSWLTLISLIVYCLNKLKSTYNNTKIRNKLKQQHCDLTLVAIYPICNVRSQGAIQTYFNKVLFEKIRIKNMEEYIRLYSEVVLNEIISPNENVEQRAIQLLKSQDKSANEVNQFPNYIEDTISNLSNLYINNKVIDKVGIKQVINAYGTDEQSWVTEPRKFDYENFKIDWLKHYNKSFLKMMSTNSNVKLKIKNKFKEEYQKGDLTKNLLNIYFDYFAD